MFCCKLNANVLGNLSYEFVTESNKLVIERSSTSHFLLVVQYQLGLFVQAFTDLNLITMSLYTLFLATN